MKVNIYLTFDGAAAEAMTFYQSVLGGDLSILRFKDMPDTSMVPEGMGDRVANARLALPGIELMASDTMGSDTMGHVFRGHSGFDIQLAPDTVEDGQRLFDALSAGGTVLMPYEPTFWAKAFGTFTDRFGVPWMVNVE